MQIKPILIDRKLPFILRQPTRPPPMPPTLDVDHDPTTTTSSKRHLQSGNSDTINSKHSSNNNRYNLKQHSSHLNTISSPLHHQRAQYNLNDRHHQTLVTLLPSQLRAYDSSKMQTSDQHNLGHLHSHSFSHNNSFNPRNQNQLLQDQFPTSRYLSEDKNDLFYLHQKSQQQFHNFSTSTSRRSHHNSKSRINDYIRISDCQSSTPQAPNYLDSSYMLTSPSSKHHSSHSSDRLQSKSTEYKQVDFIKTDALEDLRAKKADRERGKST